MLEFGGGGDGDRGKGKDERGGTIPKSVEPRPSAEFIATTCWPLA